MSHRVPQYHAHALEAEQSAPEDVMPFWFAEKFNYEYLEKFCWRRLDEIDIDLLVVASTAAFVDRRARRRRGEGWPRDFRVQIPVHCPDQWNRAGTSSALQEALAYLTGDMWNFKFVQRKHADRQALQLLLKRPAIPSAIVLPYSGGLDSFAALRLLQAQESNATPLLVTTAHGGGNPPAHRMFHGKSVERVTIPVRIAPGAHAEPTYRTRTFLFFSVAAIAAKLSGASRVIVAEPGQGAIGPSIVRFGDEHPYRGSHPAFTQRLRRLLTQLWGTSPSFEHPNIWSTKGDVLRKLRDLDILDGWQQTHSCSQRPAGRGSAGHCGICGNCISRRVAAHSASIDTDQQMDVYRWGDLSSAELVGGSSGVEIATYAILDYAGLASLGGQNPIPLDVKGAANELSRALDLSPQECVQRLCSLLERHKVEWDAFLTSLPEHSWIRKVAEEQQL